MQHSQGLQRRGGRLLSREEVMVGQVAAYSSDGRGCNYLDSEDRGGRGGRANDGLAGGRGRWRSISTASDSREKPL